MNESTGTLIHLAGAISIEREGRRATERDLHGRQPRLTFAALVWSHGRPILHEKLAEILWPAEPPPTWQPALRGLVSKVRSMFDLVGLDGASAVAGEPGRYRLDLPESTTVDVESSLEQVAEAARVLAAGGIETARRLAGEARTVLSRPLLAGVDSPWLDLRREELVAALASCLEILGECRLRIREFDHATRAVEELVRREPFREPAWRLLMRIHAEAGNVGEALRTYERCRELLADELGADPSRETQELHVRHLRGSPAPPAAADPGQDPVAAAVPAIRDIPYRGLRHFEEEHASVFFGRDVEIGVLVKRLRDHRFVAVVGPSGSGKSSLVRAGLLPALRSGALPDADTWQRIICVPGARPLEALAAAILGASSKGGSVRAAVKRLGRDQAALHDAASALLVGRPHREHLLLVVDQFEEVFTLCRDDNARREFIAALLAATRRKDARLVVVLTLRADFYGRAAAHPDLATALSTSQVLVPPLDGDALQIAIEGPARLAGLRFEDGLVGRILTEVAGQPGPLPLLQHALLELYERRVDHVLTRAAYDDMGGVSGALVQRAEELWAGFTPEQQQVLRRVLLRLIEPGEGTEDTRRRIPVEELLGGPEMASVTEEVIDELARTRLVVTSADPTTGERWIEIAHEALLRGWPRLAGWIDDDRAGLHIHRRLTGEAHEWEAHERHPDFLLSGARLSEARRWFTDHEPDINPLEHAFLEASVKEEESAARRRARVRRFVMGGLATSLVIVGVLALVASALRSRAAREGELALSREVAAEAANHLDIDPELGLLLALEAYEIAPTAEAEAALRQALVRSTLRHRLPTKGNNPNVEIGPGGAVVATTVLGGPIVLFDATSGERLATLTDAVGDPPGAGVISGMSFSPDGSRLLASTDGEAWIWSVPEGELLTPITWPKAGELLYVISQEGVAWTPDGSRVVAAGADGQARMFDAGSGELLATFRGPGPRGNFLARARLAPGGQRVAVEGSRGSVRIIEVSSGATVAEMHGHGAPLWGMKFTADGTRLATASDDTTSRIWDTSTGHQLHVLRHQVPVRDVAISNDGLRVLTGDAMGVARIWNGENGEPVLDLAGHDTRINQVRLDASGRLALTASLDGTARVWDAGSGDVIAAMVGSTEPVVDAEFSPDGNVVVTAGDDARVWRVPRSEVAVVEAHDAPVFDLALSSDGARLITGGFLDGSARVWDLAERREITTLSHAEGSIVYVDMSPDGMLAATSASYLSPGLGNRPDPVRVWDVETGDVVVELPLSGDDPLGVCGGRCAATQVAFSPDGARLAVGGFDGRVRIFDARQGEGLLTTDVATETITNVEWSPDGEAILANVAGASGQTTLLYDATTGDVLRALPALPQSLQHGQVAFGPDGRLIATTWGSTARIYEIGSGRLLSELRHRGAAHDISFSHDGSLIVTASASGAAIWDVASQRRLTDLPAVQGALAATFTPDGSIAIGGVDGTVRFYECDVCLPVDRLLQLARGRVTRELTPAERARFLHEP